MKGFSLVVGCSVVGPTVTGSVDGPSVIGSVVDVFTVGAPRAVSNIILFLHKISIP